MVTMKDVAELAAVSVATVSCVLSGKRNVNVFTKEKVLKAIDELNYIPSDAARILKSNKTKEIGVILSDIDNVRNANLLKGIISTCQQYGYNVNASLTNCIPELEKEKVEMLLSKRVAGIIIVTSMADGAEYYNNKAQKHNIPVIFVFRKPNNLDCNFACLNDNEMISNITKELCIKSYNNISLVCGTCDFDDDKIIARSFQQTLKHYGKWITSNTLCFTNLSKEDAFKKTLYAYRFNFPDAIITNSRLIAMGVLETAYVYHKKVGKDVMLITLGEENWCRNTPNGGILNTQGNSNVIGRRVTEEILSLIKSERKSKANIVVKDNFNCKNIPHLPVPPYSPEYFGKKKIINVLGYNFGTSKALCHLSDYFIKENKNVEIIYDYYNSPNDILQAIEKENSLGKKLYDLYFIDIPWTPYIGSHRLLKDITYFINRHDDSLSKVSSYSLNTCKFNEKFYGMPITAGTQLMFYRKDLFQDKYIKEDFKRFTNFELTEPRTWTEYNRILKYFTKSYNPSSPVEFGISMSNSSPEFLITNLMPCLWSNGAELFDRKTNKPTINTHAFKHALKLFVETNKYNVNSKPRIKYNDAFNDFLAGKAATTINFTEFVSSFNNDPAFINKLGYSIVPGRRPIVSGWNIGVSKYCENIADIYKYLNWMISVDVNYYKTILAGQSPLVEPTENTDLQRLYPWLTIVQKSNSFARKRRPPMAANGKIIPQYKLELIAWDIVENILNNNISIDDATAKGQFEMEKLFSEYGY